MTSPHFTGPQYAETPPPTPNHPAWLNDFVVPPNANGAVLALDFGDAGLWAARLDANRDIVATQTEERIVPHVLDVRTATYLRDTGAVPQATDPDRLLELVEVVRRARGELVDRDSVMLMGHDQLRLTTVTLDSVMNATVPEVNRTHGMIVELAGTEPVAAVLMSPGTDAWPGLWEALTERGYTMLLPGDEFPTLFGGEDTNTHAFEPLQPSTGSLAWEAQPPEEDLSTGAEPQTSTSGSSRRGKLLVAAAGVGLVAAAGAGIALAAQAATTTARAKPCRRRRPPPTRRKRSSGRPRPPPPRTSRRLAPRCRATSRRRSRPAQKRPRRSRRRPDPHRGRGPGPTSVAPSRTRSRASRRSSSADAGDDQVAGRPTGRSFAVPAGVIQDLP